MSKDYADIRNDYKLGTLDIKNFGVNPFMHFEAWIHKALDSKVMEPTAMSLATVSPEGMPAVRTVLLKGMTTKGLVFFTNYNSKKGRHIALNPKASVLFFWPELERQIRVEGYIEPTSADDSDDYFDSRPTESKVSAIISPQSHPIPSRHYLEELAEAYEGIPNSELERPNYWGGYRIIPQLFEFWQGRPGRLHDRIEYKISNGSWTKELLAP